MYQRDDPLDHLVEAELGRVQPHRPGCSDQRRVLAALVGSQLECGRARVLAMRGDARAADAAFAEGIRQLRPLGLPYALARWLLGHGAVLITLRREDEAAKVLHEARATFAQLGATPWLERVDAVRPPATAA